MWGGWKNHEIIYGIKTRNLYFLYDNREDKKTNYTKKCVIKRKLKFENYKNYLEATQLENKMKHLEKNRIDIDTLKIFS